MARLAAEQGRAADALVIEPVERLVSYDEWFLKEVEKVWRQLIMTNLSIMRVSES